METQEWLAERFEEHWPRMRSVAYRMLGSTTEAGDAVQETWLRASRADSSEVEDLGAWLTTIVGRVSLNMLRARRLRREDPLAMTGSDPLDNRANGDNPEREAILADSVGQAMLVVLDTLSPDERLAFVLHDMFSVPFDEIASIIDRSPAATRQLASRARRRVRDANPPGDADPAEEPHVVDAFLAAARNGDFQRLIAVLHPDVVLRVDAGAAAGIPKVIRGAEAVASRALTYSRLDLTVQRALIDGAPGLVTTLEGRLFSAGSLTVRDGKIIEMTFLADSERLSQLELTMLDSRQEGV